jgi:hypothetical protein
MIDYATPDPALLERVKTASSEELARYLANAKRKLPATRWLVEAIATEQLKRRGLQNFNAQSIRQVILDHARRGRTCTYKTIAATLGLEWSQAHRRLPHLLGEISEGEHAERRPLLTAIVVAQNGKCGQGFFDMARAKCGKSFVDNESFQRGAGARLRLLAQSIGIGPRGA